MQCNQAGLALIKSFEKCSLFSYQDTRGIWTIGWGHTGPAVMADQTCTQDEADAWLAQDLSVAEGTVNAHVTVGLNENQFSALCSFTFNVGSGNFDHSTLLKEIDADNLDDVPNQLLLWDKNHDGTVNAGLLRRRIAEKQLWMTPPVDQSSDTTTST